MNGFAILLKSMGFDPEVIMQSVEAAKIEVAAFMTRLDTRLQAIEETQRQILAAQKETNDRIEAIAPTEYGPDEPHS